MKNILRGFTLSEVLIALGIIGVVAALTMPALEKNVGDKALTAQLTKMNASIEEGIKRYMAAENISDVTSPAFNFDTFATEYLDILQVCNNNKNTICFADKYKGIDRKTVFANNTNAYVLKDGTTISYQSDGHSLPVIYIDVNGKEKPNRYGYDLQQVTLASNGSLESWAYVASSKIYTVTPEDLEERGFPFCGTSAAMYCYSALKRNNFKFPKIASSTTNNSSSNSDNGDNGDNGDSGDHKVNILPPNPNNPYNNNNNNNKFSTPNNSNFKDALAQCTSDKCIADVYEQAQKADTTDFKQYTTTTTP